MKIAIDAREMVTVTTGKSRYTNEVVLNLAKIDRENTYFLYSKRPLNAKLPENFQNIIIGGLPGLRQLWFALDAKKRGCTVLFSPTGYLPVIFSLIPSVVTIHDVALFIVKEARPALKTLIAERLLIGLALKRSKAVVTISESTKKDLVKHFAVLERKITVAPLGYDKEKYRPNKTNDETVLARHSLKPDYLLFVGTLEPRKNVTGLTRAYAKLSPELRTAHPLVIGGGKGWHYEEIFTSVKELDLEKQIYFLGRVNDDDLPALYRNAKLFLFPSFYEGFGLPPLEALACGTPVVVANNSSLPEVVGEAGELVDAYNEDDISRKIESLPTNQEKYQKLKKQAVKQAESFDWQKTAAATLATFKKVAK